MHVVCHPKQIIYFFCACWKIHWTHPHYTLSGDEIPLKDFFHFCIICLHFDNAYFNQMNAIKSTSCVCVPIVSSPNKHRRMSIVRPPSSGSGLKPVSKLCLAFSCDYRTMYHRELLPVIHRTCPAPLSWIQNCVGGAFRFKINFFYATAKVCGWEMVRKITLFPMKSNSARLQNEVVSATKMQHHQAGE